MPIDFSQIGGTPAHTGHIDFSAIGGIPAVGQDEPTEDTTTLGAAGRGAVGMFPLGEQAYSAIAGGAEHKPYVQERQELEKEIEADRANHPIARLAGQAAGVVAPALLTGGASAPESLLGAAGQGAALGAGFGAGNAIDTLATGGSGGKAAADVALGAGMGAAGGALGQKVAGALKGAVPGIEEFAAKKAAQGVGMGSEELGNLSQPELIDTGKMLMDKGIIKPGASTQEMFDTAKALHEQYGDQIGQIAAKSKELGLSTDIKPLLQQLESKYQAASQLENPDEMRNALFYKKGMADILTMARQNLPDTLADVQGAPVPNDITFDQLQRLKRSYGNSAFMNGTVKNPAAADVYSALSSGQKAIVKTARENPELPGELKDAMTGYSKLSPVVDGLQDVLGRERAGNMPAKGFGMIGKMIGQLPGQNKPAINALTSLGLLGAGHPLWAVGAATATLQNPRAMATMAQSAANAIPGIASTLPSAGAQIASSIVPSEIKSPATVDPNHPALAPWRQTFQQNAAKAQTPGELDKANAVTNFVLSQRDPAYAAAKQKAADNPTPEPTSMAEGGVVADNDEIQGVSSPKIETNTETEKNRLPDIEVGVPAKKPAAPFNTDMADKLKAFLQQQKERDDAQSR